MMLMEHRLAGERSLSVNPSHIAPFLSMNIPEQQWQEIDSLLFAGRKLQAVIAIRSSGEPALEMKPVQDLMYERYAILRAEQPGRFACDEDSYWDDWYS